MKKFELRPLKGLGDILLGDKLKDLERRYPQMKYSPPYPEDEPVASDYPLFYELVDEDITLGFSSDTLRLFGISTYKYCYFKGKNVIGMSISEFEKLIGQKASEINEVLDYGNFIQIPYIYKSLGLQAWEEDRKFIAMVSIDEP